MASSLAHSAGPAMVAISQPWRVDQHRGRHAQRPAYRFKILKNLGFLVAEIAEPGQIGLLQEVLRLFGVAGVDVDRDHLEIRSAEFGLQASSAGISLRQGTHQVAQRLTSTVRPRQSDSFFGLPSASSKARSGSRRARSPWSVPPPRHAPTGRACAPDRPRRGRPDRRLQYASSPPIPYTPANPISAPITTAPIATGIRRIAAGRG